MIGLNEIFQTFKKANKNTSDWLLLVKVLVVLICILNFLEGLKFLYGYFVTGSIVPLSMGIKMFYWPVVLNVVGLILLPIIFTYFLLKNDKGSWTFTFVAGLGMLFFLCA